MRHLPKYITLFVLIISYIFSVFAEPISIILDSTHLETKEVCCCGEVEDNSCCASSCSLEQSHQHETPLQFGFTTIPSYVVSSASFVSNVKLENKEENNEISFLEIIQDSFSPKEKSIRDFLILKHTSSSLV
jgi:hypothetical protein